VLQANQQHYHSPIIDSSLSQVASSGKRLTDFVYGLSLLLTRLSITRLRATASLEKKTVATP